MTIATLAVLIASGRSCPFQSPRATRVRVVASAPERKNSVTMRSPGYAAEDNPDLTAVVEALPDVPEAISAAILALVKVASERDGRYLAGWLWVESRNLASSGLPATGPTRGGHTCHATFPHGRLTDRGQSSESGSISQCKRCQFQHGQTDPEFLS